MNFRRGRLHACGMREPKRMPPYENLAKWRRHIDKNLSQERLAERMEITQEQVSRYETGTDQMTLPVLHAWAEALGIEPEAFWRAPDAPRNELAEAWAMAERASEPRQQEVARVVKALLAAA